MFQAEQQASCIKSFETAWTPWQWARGLPCLPCSTDKCWHTSPWLHFLFSHSALFFCILPITIGSSITYQFVYLLYAYELLSLSRSTSNDWKPKINIDFQSLWSCNSQVFFLECVSYKYHIYILKRDSFIYLIFKDLGKICWDNWCWEDSDVTERSYSRNWLYILLSHTLAVETLVFSSQ